MNEAGKLSTRKMVLGAILTALVFILQYMGSFIKLGPFSISLVLIPIVIGAATCGKGIGAWLGLVFGVAVLVSGDAAAFLAVSLPGTVITVLAKGVLCGLAASLAYEAALKICTKLSPDNGMCCAVIAAAVVCPVVNTGVFLIGCLLFFMETITEWAGGGNVGRYMIVVLVGLNFVAEFVVNILLSPVITRLIAVRNKQ